jgi:putative flippase GtrA
MIKQFTRFGTIGLTALSTHLLIVMFLVTDWEIPPLMANIVGFLCAFQISYWGHCKWTFTAQPLSHQQAMSRLFLVSSSSFLLNEMLYAGLLNLTTLRYDVALFIVLIFVSALTFVLSKFWVFPKSAQE